jgi:hypothetical protein
LTAYDDDSFSILGIAYFAAMWLRRVGADDIRGPSPIRRLIGWQGLISRAETRIEHRSWEIVST